MSSWFVWVSALLVVVLAGLNWWAVTPPRRLGLERVAKPGALLALLLLAVALGALDSVPGRWVIVALVFGLAGDVLLIGDDDEVRFLGGLAAFLVGHLAWVAAFAAQGLPAGWAWYVVGAVFLVGALVYGREILPATQRDGGLAMSGPVAAYMAIVGLMQLMAFGTGRWLVALGACFFVVTDTALALDRFVRTHPWRPLFVMVTYHLAQVLLTVGLLTA